MGYVRSPGRAFDISNTTLGRTFAPPSRSSPEGPRSSRITVLTGSELISRSSGRFLYSRRTVVNEESSGSDATNDQITIAIASESSFHQIFLSSAARTRFQFRDIRVTDPLVTDPPVRLV